ncbi:MAG: SURF1 family protein [Ramlibacter sp.]|nr:SURF1 family protein [Ramlibacter sp.]
MITLAAVAGIALTQALGFWQLSRAAQKEALQAAIEARKHLPALDNRALSAIKDVASEVHRPVALRGRWLARHTVYLDNRQMGGHPGFYVLTAFQPEGLPAVVMVQRGWVPRNFLNREQLPPVETPASEVLVQGRLAPAPSRLFEFSSSAAAGPESGSSVIRQNLDLAAYGAQTGLPVAPWTVLQTGAASEGLQRDWPEVASGVGKHYGYAFQWFGLSGLMAILYVWYQFIAPRRRRPAAS